MFALNTPYFIIQTAESWRVEKPVVTYVLLAISSKFFVREPSLQGAKYGFEILSILVIEIFTI